MREFIYNNKPVEACYGCQACAQVCPRDAITIQPNGEGFIYPTIDPTLCIDCGLCEKVCPTQDDNIEVLFHELPTHVHAAWNKNLGERLNSTSGGVFFLIARKFIENGGIVYGVDYRKDLTVSHCRVTDVRTLEHLRGSKYMQSDVNGAFLQVKRDLREGHQVLFSGTPCQIAGLRLFLRKPYANLFTIDVVCHGVPSPEIFKAHVKYLETYYGDKLKDFKFRAKKSTGWRSYTKYVFEHKKPVYKFLGEDLYSHLFHSGCLSRESCFTCAFSQGHRVGDITLSDFWNGERFSKELRRERKFGFNMVMCNSVAGEKLLSSVAADVESRSIPIEFALKGDIRLRQSEDRPQLRESIYKLYKEKGYSFLVEKYSLKQSMLQKLVPAGLKNLIRELQSKL